MTWTVMLWTSLVPWLLLWWVFQRAAGLRGYLKTAVAGLAALATVWFPWFGHSLPFWSASLSANFSVIMAALLAVGIFDRARGGDTLRSGGWQGAWIFGAVASVLLYPSALGLGPRNFDSYALGWPWLFWGQSLWLCGGAGFVAALLIWRGNRFGYVVFLAMLGYAAGFQESDNLWDYLLDPVYGTVSLLAVLRMLWRRFIPRSRSGDPSGKADR
jgi:hypothetical protein